MKQRLVVGTMLCRPTHRTEHRTRLGRSVGHKPVVHVVRWGENLIYIAGQYRTSVQAIMTMNGLSNPNRIYAGRRC